MYGFSFKDFSSELISTCHYSAVSDIVFPRSATPPAPCTPSPLHPLTPAHPHPCGPDCRDSAELFATSSCNDVRVWHAATGKELLRITVANLTCHAVSITPDGKAILTGWLLLLAGHTHLTVPHPPPQPGTMARSEPTTLRAGSPCTPSMTLTTRYTPPHTLTPPHTPSHLLTLPHTSSHSRSQGVTALACTSDSRRIISGGGEGQVRVWGVANHGQNMLEALKEHKGAVTCIKLRHNDEEVWPQG